MILYIAFALMTWVANPLFNLLLRLNRFGRLALSREELITSNWVAACVSGAILSLIACVVFQASGALMLTLACGLIIPPLSAVYHCERGWPRTTTIVISVALAAVGLFSSILVITSTWLDGPFGDQLLNTGLSLFFWFVLGAIASQFAVHGLASAVVRR